MRHNFYIDYESANDILPENANWIECYPEDVQPFKLERFRANFEMEQNFERLLWGEVTFSNNPKLYLDTGSNIYRLFDVIFNLSFNQRILVKYETEKETVYGYFGRNDCSIDKDTRILTVEPAVLDDYTDIIENWETEVDFSEWEFTENTVTIEITNNTLQTKEDWPYPPILSGGSPTTPRNKVKEKDYNDAGGLSAYFDGQEPKDELFTDTYWRFEGTHKVIPPIFVGYVSYTLQDRIDILGETVTPANRENIPDEYGDWELSRFRVYEGNRSGGLSGNRWRNLYCETDFSRDEEVKVDVVDVTKPYGYEPPVGDGWNMRGTRIKNGQNAHLWTRVPFNGAYSDSWELQPEVINSSESTYSFTWNKYLETRLIYDNTENTFDIVSTINLRDYIQHIIRNSNSALSAIEFKSTFFFNDFENDLEVLKDRPGFNYVNGVQNYLNGCKIFFTKDLTIPEEGEVENVPKFTLKSILTELHQTFVEKLIWFIDSNGYFRIEHERYSDLRKTSLDIRVTDEDLLNFTNQWDYDKTKMFERFEYRQVNAGYPDFTDNLVTYDKIISNNRNEDLKREVITRTISTDAKYCVLNPDDLNAGIVLITVDSNDVVLNKAGEISKVIETNGYLALSNILLDFGRYSGVWHNGNMNGRDVTFQVTTRTKLGVDINLRGTKRSLFYTTQIGVGLLEDGTIDFEEENTTVKLRYRYNSSVNGDVFALVFQKETDFAGASNNWADIDNYIIST